MTLGFFDREMRHRDELQRVKDRMLIAVVALISLVVSSALTAATIYMFMARGGVK